MRLPPRTVVVNGTAGRTLSVERNIDSLPPTAARKVSVADPNFSYARAVKAVVISRPSGMTSGSAGRFIISRCSEASTLTVNLGLTATPGTFSLTIAGTSGLLTHSVSAQVTVQASTSGTTTVIDGLGKAGCIDSSGISGSLVAKLAQAQDDIDAGRIQDAINTLSALLNQLLAQSGKHIFSSCTIDGQTFNPAEVLINDVRAILATLQA